MPGFGKSNDSLRDCNLRNTFVTGANAEDPDELLLAAVRSPAGRDDRKSFFGAAAGGASGEAMEVPLVVVEDTNDAGGRALSTRKIPRMVEP